MKHFNGRSCHDSWMYTALNPEEPDTDRSTPPCSVFQRGMLMLMTAVGVVAIACILVRHMEQ